MRYLLLSYTPVDAWDSAEVDTGTPSEDALAAFAVYAEFQRELSASGELVATEGLAHPSLSQTVRKQADAVTVTDGPFAEFKEVLASYAVLDCASHDRALEIARRVVDAIGDAVKRCSPRCSGGRPKGCLSTLAAG
jgi:hypothetical protein